MKEQLDVNIDVDDGESSNEDKDGGGLEIPTNVSSTSDVVSQATSRNGGEEEAISSSSEVETLFEIEPQIGTCGYPNQRSSGGVIIPFNHHNIHAFRLAQQLVGVTALALYIGLWQFERLNHKLVPVAIIPTTKDPPEVLVVQSNLPIILFTVKLLWQLPSWHCFSVCCGSKVVSATVT